MNLTSYQGVSLSAMVTNVILAANTLSMTIHEVWFVQSMVRFTFKLHINAEYKTNWFLRANDYENLYLDNHQTLELDLLLIKKDLLNKEYGVTYNEQTTI